MKNTKKFIVLEMFLDSSNNEYFHTYLVDDKKTAIKLANTLIEAFVKTEMLDGYEKEDFEKWGDFKTGNRKFISNQEHSETVEIQECVSISNFAIVEKKDEYGKYFEVEVNKLKEV